MRRLFLSIIAAAFILLPASLWLILLNKPGYTFSAAAYWIMTVLTVAGIAGGVITIFLIKITKNPVYDHRL